MRLLLLTLFALPCFLNTSEASTLVFEGSEGPGKGRHIVFLAGDHEYRSEESLPALARLLAKHHGFQCTVLFNIDPVSGEIVAGTPSNIPGMEVLATADLAVVFLRFQDLPDDQMTHLDQYLKRGGPVVGMRTATHGFNIPAEKQFAQYSYDSKVKGYELGFGHQVLGQTWVGHYGRNHRQSTRITLVDAMKEHAILRGVKDVWVQAGAYVGKPVSGDVLTMAQPLDGMKQDSPASETQPPMPSEWTRAYRSESGTVGRVFTSLYGTPEDLTNDGYRRLMVNGIFWACGLEEAITADLDISFVGPFRPNTFGHQRHARGIKPEAYAGFDSPIPAHNEIIKPVQKPARQKPGGNQQKAKERTKVPQQTAVERADSDAWVIDTQVEWQQNTMTRSGVETVAGMASPTARKATLLSTLKTFKTKRAAKSIVFEQSPVKGFAKQVARIPAQLDLSELPDGYGFQFEIALTDTTENESKPILDKVTLAF